MAEDKTLNEIAKRFGITGNAARDIAKKVNSVVASSKPMPKKPVASRTPSKAVKTPMPKTTAKPSAKKPTPKLTGPAAVKEYQRQVSPKGVKKAEEGAKKGLDKKYPGLYKKSK
jgi:hypothetical protein